MNLLTIHIIMIKISLLCYMIVLIKKFVKNNILKIGKLNEEKQEEFDTIVNEAKWTLTDKGIEIIKYFGDNILVTYILFFVLCLIPIINIIMTMLLLNVLFEDN
jgi:hypothetical protein